VVQDVAYWMNHELATRQQPSFCCINTAVEATTLDDRACGSLLPQDRFLREHIREDDALVVSGASLTLPDTQSPQPLGALV